MHKDVPFTPGESGEIAHGSEPTGSVNVLSRVVQSISCTFK